ncbi:MAG TPA: O-methyltransferase [Niabella sp.]|nr:O-methyltransferase [Niabella sp.]HQW14943.1 O-methyltransferase [Niabella sp.]HQX20165.1 O-methyltransferase [Niabella sp.]HQX41921.1 O-methyltransferase [Niabella sp.]HRB06770.1 O-methyltransferase [Niabella sp.]
MDYELLNQFAAQHTSLEDLLLAEVNEFTSKNHTQPHMLSGHVQGQLLSMISSMIRPKRILEIGTFTGYSALCLAKGLTEGGVLHTVESREATAQIAHDFFQKSDSRDKIKLHVGNALDIIPQLKEAWDLVFLDADKSGYIHYFNLVFPDLKKNAFILADNIFFHGSALDENPKGKSAKAIKSFNEFINNRTDIDKVVLTVRDGLYLIRKI